MLQSQHHLLSLPRFLDGSLFTLSPPLPLPAHQVMAGISADGLHGNLPPLWPRRCTKLAHEGSFLIAVFCLLLSSRPLQSSHCSTLQPSPVLSLLNTLPPFLDSPFPHHSHGANSQHLKKTRSTASPGTCYFTCPLPSPSFLPLLSTPPLLEAPPIPTAVPFTQMYLCAFFPD